MTGFGRTSHPQDRIVVLAPNWLGDAVMALPALRDIRNHFAGVRLAVAARRSVAQLFECVPAINEVVVLSSRGGSTTIASGQDDVRSLRDRGFDVAILFPNSFHTAWLARRAGVRERWGYRAGFRGPLLTRAVRRPRGKVHYGAYYQDLVRGLGMQTGPLTPRVVVAGARRDAAQRMLEQEGWASGEMLVGVAPGAAYGHAKRWPSDRFAELIHLLREQGGARCVLLGSLPDRATGQEIVAALERLSDGRGAGRLINLIGRTDLLGLMGVMSHCRAFVANDSGGLHLAAAIGLSVTAIFGPTDERYSTPLATEGRALQEIAVLTEPVWCRPCGLRECPIDHRCMTRIPAARVFDAVRGQIRAAEGARQR